MDGTGSDIPLPIRADQGRLTVNGISPDGKPDTLTLTPELRFGALQAFYDGRRSLLVATSNGAPAQLDALLGWVSADPRRFSKLDGIALVGAPGQQPVVIGPQPGVSGSAAGLGGRAVVGGRCGDSGGGHRRRRQPPHTQPETLRRNR